MNEYQLYVNHDGTPIMRSPVSPDEDTCTFTMNSAFLEAYFKYLQQINEQTGIPHVIELCIPLRNDAHEIPGIRIVEAKQQ